MSTKFIIYKIFIEIYRKPKKAQSRFFRHNCTRGHAFRKCDIYTTGFQLSQMSGEFFLTARCYACAVYAMALCPSVCLSGCPSVTSRCSTKTGKRRITKITPQDSPGTLVFRSQRSPRNSTWVNPCRGTKCRWGGSKSATFDKYLATSRKRHKIDAWFILKSNRKTYAFYRMVTLPMTLSDR